MTIIIGYKENDVLYFGVDSRISSDHKVFTLSDDKIWSGNGILFGVCGHWRAAQIVKHKFNIPERPCKMSTEKYMNTVFIDELRKVFKENGYTEINNNEEKAHGAYLMIGIDNRLFNIGYDFSVLEQEDNYICLGSGEDLAYGAMNILKDQNLDPIDKIIKALETACKYNSGCAPPFTIISNNVNKSIYNKTNI